ncbi:hypothetical protein RvY_18631 [Ramazzottius varieornatus]|uniref:Uncharacterized protein n=1 Tax=Ramazzottius varieornatus TaxID=947166 RepID=A0A1D1W6G9_RAMVA|nr:hypothetical protein RvY_18631 [Ramazzottius varieornatus]
MTYFRRIVSRQLPADTARPNFIKDHLLNSYSRPLDMASFKLLTASQVSKQLSMDDAVRAVKEGGITMYAAAKQHVADL